MSAGGAPVTGTARSLRRPELEEERAFLLRSIEDLDAEHEAGDMSEGDYRALRDRYTARAAAVLRSLSALDETETDVHVGASGSGSVESRREEGDGEPRRPPSHRRRILLWGAVGAFAAAAVIVAATELATRLPGQTATGSLRLGAAQQIARTDAQAQALEEEGKPSEALTLYRQVLRQDPTQEQALAEAGWLEFEAGIAARNSAAATQGQRDEESAERVDPGAYAPHLYLGSMLLVERRPSDAADEFARFLSSSPPAGVVGRAWKFVVQAYTEAGKPVPAAPPGVTATSAP